MSLQKLDLPPVDDFHNMNVLFMKDGSALMVPIRKKGEGMESFPTDDLVYVSNVYSFKIWDVLYKAEKYQEFLEALNEKDFVLRREYEALKDYVRKLESRQPKPKSSFLNSMIRRC